VRFDPSVINELVAPAVLIPACGLLMLLTNARMVSVIARLRHVHADIIALYVNEPDESPRARHARQIRAIGMDEQSDIMLRRLRLMKLTMMLLFAAVPFLLLSGGLIGLADALDSGPIGAAALAAFLMGGLAMALAMIVSLVEVGIGLRTVMSEHARVCQLARDLPGATDMPHTLKPCTPTPNTGAPR